MKPPSYSRINKYLLELMKKESTTLIHICLFEENLEVYHFQIEIPEFQIQMLPFTRGWSGGAMVLGKLPVPGRPTIWLTVGQGPTVLAVGAGGGCLDIFTLLYPFSPLSPSLWETTRYRLKYCLKGL